VGVSAACMLLPAVNARLNAEARPSAQRHARALTLHAQQESPLLREGAAGGQQARPGAARHSLSVGSLWRRCSFWPTRWTRLPSRRWRGPPTVRPRLPVCVSLPDACRTPALLSNSKASACLLWRAGELVCVRGRVASSAGEQQLVSALGDGLRQPLADAAASGTQLVRALWRACPHRHATHGCPVRTVRARLPGRLWGPGRPAIQPAGAAPAPGQLPGALRALERRVRPKDARLDRGFGRQAERAVAGLPEHKPPSRAPAVGSVASCW